MSLSLTDFPKTENQLVVFNGVTYTK